MASHSCGPYTDKDLARVADFRNRLPEKYFLSLGIPILRVSNERVLK
jgi:hypothetical protein